MVGLRRHFDRARPLLDEEGVASQLWTLCCRSCLAIFEIFSNNNVSNRKRCTLRKGSFKTSSKSWNIKFLVNSQYYTYLPFTYKQLTNMDYFRALFGSQSIYKQNFEIYGTQNFKRLMFYIKLAECVPILATSIWLINLLHEQKSTTTLLERQNQIWFQVGSTRACSWFNQSPLILYSCWCWLVDHSNGYKLARCSTIMNQWCQSGHLDLLHIKD